MEKDSFLDTNVIFNYANYAEQPAGIVRKCYLYIANKKGRFIVCGQVLKELENIAKKRAELHKAVIHKVINENLQFDTLLDNQDIPYAKKLYEKLKNQNAREVSALLELERDLLVASIQKFLETGVDERAIPAEQIDPGIANILNEFIDNYADCRILASALQFQTLQFQKNRPLFLFVTADQHFDVNGWNFIKEDARLKAQHCQFPELKNLLFADN